MDVSQIMPHVEALIFASDKPLTSLELVDLVNNALGFIEDRATLDQLDAAIDGIREKYQAEFYPFEIRQSGGGWQFLTKKDYHKTIAQLNGDKFLKRLSTAALETLAIIAYKQPITKSEIESIRGVNCDYAVQKLLEKDLIIIAGRNEDAVGKPLLYATSRSFMDYFGLNSAADLPKISEVLMDELVQATIVQATNEAETAALEEAAADAAAMETATERDSDPTDEAIELVDDSTDPSEVSAESTEADVLSSDESSDQAFHTEEDNSTESKQDNYKQDEPPGPDA
jgi:segregation and condensation protein B